MLFQKETKLLQMNYSNMNIQRMRQKDRSSPQNAPRKHTT